MYDDNYIKEVLGSNYSFSDYYADSTYNNNSNVFSDNLYHKYDDEDKNIKNDKGKENNKEQEKDKESGHIKEAKENIEDQNSKVKEVDTKEVNTRETSKVDTNNSKIVDKEEKLEILENVEKLEKIKEIAANDVEKEENNIKNWIEDKYEKHEYEEDNNEDFNIRNLYPEIYKMIEPVVEVATDKKLNGNLTKDIFEDIVSEVYNVLEEDYDKQNEEDSVLVSARPYHRKNSFLEDLIKILIINHLTNNRPPRCDRPKDHNMRSERPPRGPRR